MEYRLLRKGTAIRLDIPESSIDFEETQLHLRDGASTAAENQTEGHEQDIVSSLNSSTVREGSDKEVNSDGPSTSAENPTEAREQDKNSLPRRASEGHTKEVKSDGLDIGEKERRQQEEQEENSSVMRRRIGVVEASDKAVEERMKARVLRKRFGVRSVVWKMEGIFNKKL